MPSPQLDEDTFKERFRAQFQYAAYEAVEESLARVAEAAWTTYRDYRKSPRTRKAGPEFLDPDFELSEEWLDARSAILAAQARHEDEGESLRVLVVNASPRSEHTCPGEISKTYRLAELAEQVFRDEGCEVELLDLARRASEYGRKIHPCKAYFSTAAAPCHWPCSCYPNHAMGQTQDWMNARA
jgi:hypothetical protein